MVFQQLLAMALVVDRLIIDSFEKELQPSNYFNQLRQNKRRKIEEWHE
jgi:hypothetical protein